jgi:CarD family transcriptional regulator
MVARTKSKKTTSSKTKKTGAASAAKTKAKRATKAASPSSVRTRASKSKTASNTRVARKTSKTVRAKTKNAATKLAKRKRTSANSRPVTHQSAAAKRPASAASRRVAAAKSPSKTTRAAATAKRAAAVRAQLKEQEAKLLRASRIAPEAKAVTEKVSAPIAASKPSSGPAAKPSSGPAAHVAHSTEMAAPAKPAAPVVKVQKPVVSEEAPAAAKTLKSASQRQGFKLNEFVVYPAHGVGQIVSIEEQEVAGFRLELFVISFSKDKLTLRVPTSKVTGVGMRKISDPDAARRSLDILTGRARVKRTMWSRRAQEYETKINSGDINAIAEVVRDLYRSEAQPEQSYSERQLYEAALDRMVREIAAVQKSTEIDALKAVEAQLQKGQSRMKALGPPSATGEIEEQAA